MGAKHLSLARVSSANGASPSEMVTASCFSTGVGDAQGSVCLLRGSVVPCSAPKAERELQFRFLYMLMSSAALAAAKPGGGVVLSCELHAAPKTGSSISKRTERSSGMETLLSLWEL